MSTLTLSESMINTILAPISTDLPAKADPSLIQFAQGVVNLDRDGKLAEVFAPLIAATTPVQTAPRKPKAVKSADVADWKLGKPSDSQLSRLNRLESALDAHYGEVSTPSVMADFKSAGDLSDWYKPLAAEGKALGLNWAA